MAAKTDAAARRGAIAATATAKKPSFAIFIATAGGLGYFPKAPGTFGSLAGLLLAVAPMWIFNFAITSYMALSHQDQFRLWRVSSPLKDPFLLMQIALAILVALVGTWAASQAAKFWNQDDPQRVVIDEVSGQHLTLLLGCAVPIWWRVSDAWTDHDPLGLITWHSALNWKYLLVGFILFRLFDIWKPFPARQAESLPGGWGIMADDWMAGVYAGICLWLTRAAGL
jgi:phosphatidylglycerophosphatase A